MVTKAKNPTTWNGLKRSPLKAKTHLKRGAGLKVKSERQKRIDTLWAGVKQQKILETGGVCEICGAYKGFNLIAHHKLRRSYNVHTINNCAVVCQECHDHIDADPNWAISMGFKIQGY